MNIEFGKLKREELKAAVALAARAYQDYAYVALYFPDDAERRRGLHAFMNCVMKSNFGRADILGARIWTKRLANLATTIRKRIPECGISVCSRSILPFRDKASALGSWLIRRTMSGSGVAVRWSSSRTRKRILPSIPAAVTKCSMSANWRMMDEKSVVGV